MNEENNIRKIKEIKETTRELRLLYYNNYLLQNGVISRRDHEKMNSAIIAKNNK